MADRLFISHASADAAIVQRIVAYLEARGVRCWMAPRDLPRGAPFATEIVKAIEGCDRCIVVASAAANQSEDVENELNIAARYRKPLVPIRIDGAELAPHLLYYLSKRQWADFNREGERALDSIVTRGAGASAATRALSRLPMGAGLTLVGALFVGVALLMWSLRPQAPPAQVQVSDSDEQNSRTGLRSADARLETSAGTSEPPANGEDAPPTSPPHPRGDAETSAPTPDSVKGPTTSRRTIFNTLSIEPLANPDQSPLAFPTAYFNQRLRQELGGATTQLRQIRLAVAFVEPRESRRRAGGGTVIGYVQVALPSLPGCTRQFGGPSYTFDNAGTALLGAVNETAPHIATWLERASSGEDLTCPN